MYRGGPRQKAPGVRVERPGRAVRKLPYCAIKCGPGAVDGLGVNIRPAPWEEASARAETRRTVVRARQALLAHGSDESRRRRRYGLVAGVLFVVAALTTLPAGLDMEHSARWAVYVLTFVAVSSGLVCLMLPWERLPPYSLHVLPLAAGLEISAVIRATDPAAGVLFVLVAVFAAYAFASRAQIAVHLTLIGLFLFAPLLYVPDAQSSTIHHGLLELPTIVLAASLVTYLRERTEAQEQTLRRFAGEAIEIAARMVGAPTRGEGGTVERPQLDPDRSEGT